MTKKICHITSVHPRYDGRIFRKMCVSLANNGYDVTLLVIDNKPDEVKDGVHIIPIDKQFKNSFDRIFNSWKFLYKKALEINADIYHLHDPELIQLGTKLKQKGKKVIFDSHEDYVLSILQKNWLPQFSRTLVQKMYAKYEKKKLAKFDGIIGVTPQLMTHLKTINDNIVMITNYPLLENVKRKDSSGFTLCFAGGITPNWSHESIIKAVNKFEGAVRYNLMGNIDDRYKEKLQMLEGFKYVNLIGTVSYHDVLEYYGASSLGIALHKYMPMVYDHEGSLGNTKIFEMMMSELPVICTDFTLWTEIIEKNQTGKCMSVKISNKAKISKQTNKTFTMSINVSKSFSFFIKVIKIAREKMPNTTSRFSFRLSFKEVTYSDKKNITNPYRIIVANTVNKAMSSLENNLCLKAKNNCGVIIIKRIGTNTL